MAEARLGARPGIGNRPSWIWRSIHASAAARRPLEMQILVCLKQVAASDEVMRVHPSGTWIEESDASFAMNEPDSFALEEGLRLKEKHGGEVIAVSAGPARAGSTIREALAKGADRGILVEDERLSNSDSLSTARALAAAIGREKHDLVLTGLQSGDAGFGQTGVIVAELLGLPHATLIMEVSAGIMEAGAGKTSVRVKRELEAGWFQYVELPLPALLTIQSGINTVRYATLMGIKKAKSKPLARYTCEDLGIEIKPAQIVRRLYTPERSKQTQFLEGAPGEVARKLVDKLKFEARVL